MYTIKPWTRRQSAALAVIMFVPTTGLDRRGRTAAATPCIKYYTRLMANTTAWFSLRKRYVPQPVVVDNEDFIIFFPPVFRLQYFRLFPVFV